MYKNLLFEMSRINLTMADIAKDNSYDYGTIRNKFNEITEWKRNEMFILQEKYFPTKELKYLFEKEGE